MHDRLITKELKQFHKKNVGVNRTPLKETSLQHGNTVYSSSDYAWQDLTSVANCVDALANFGICLMYLWSYDMTALTLLKLYNNYR